MAGYSPGAGSEAVVPAGPPAENAASAREAAFRTMLLGVSPLPTRLTITSAMTQTKMACSTIVAPPSSEHKRPRHPRKSVSPRPPPRADGHVGMRRRQFNPSPCTREIVRIASNWLPRGLNSHAIHRLSCATQRPIAGGGSGQRTSVPDETKKRNALAGEVDVLLESACTND
jgi:hypothetical protein